MMELTNNEVDKDDDSKKCQVNPAFEAESKELEATGQGNMEGDSEQTVDNANKAAQVSSVELYTFEYLLSLVGENGIWNISMFLLIFIGPYISTFTVISYQFLGATPDYWCQIQELIDANWTTSQIIDFALPRKDNGDLDGCSQWDYNYTLAASLGYEAAKTNQDLFPKTAEVPKVSCPVRDFNTTQYASTLVTEFDLVCERRALYSTTAAIVQIGKLFSSLFIGYITDTIGKRRVLLFCPMFVLFFGLVGITAPTIQLYTLCKFFAALFDMGMYVTCYVLALELASKPQRSSIGSLFGIPWSLGTMTIAGIAYGVRTWKYLQMALTLPYITFGIYYWFLPESPRWLILQGRYKDAIDLLRQGARMNGRELPPDSELEIIMERIRQKDIDDHKENYEEGGSENDTRIEKVKRSLIGGLYQVASLFATITMAKQTLIMFFCWFSVGFVYYGMAQNGTNLSDNEYWYTFFGGLLEIPPCFLMWPAVAIAGRRRTFIALYVIAAATILGSLGIQGSENWVITLALIGKSAAVNAFSMVYLLSSELNTTKARTVAVGISSVIARFGSIVTPYINDLVGASNPSAPSAMFGTVALISAVLVFFLPETKKHVLPESMAEVEGMSKKTDREESIP
ncbi:organic cation transporter protein-like [Oratosquilla oratoria]|uniref:organic cation transporter protein-like n=1 Tax=Oratosquilla oratoria TaxID=337810 RepID=UPI003F76572B